MNAALRAELLRNAKKALPLPHGLMEPLRNLADQAP
jgi:hypothetical protein